MIAVPMPRELYISIHALRGEGDTVFLTYKLFNIEFQSTPSVGRATSTDRKDSNTDQISIHALRGEGDNRSGL